MKILLIIFYLLLSTIVAVATEPRYPVPSSIPCWKIKAYIFIHGQDVAYTWATARYNQKQIDEIRKRCSL